LELLTMSAHLPPQHAGCVPALHAVPHAPQFMASLFGSIHLPAQHIWLPPQAGVHAPGVIGVVHLPP
jgi:hypothetical protein